MKFKFTETHSELPTQEEVNSFLDWLRMTGKTNTVTLSDAFIREHFGITKYDANRFLVRWMESFNTQEKSENDQT
jgi:hypothetical protein